MTAFQLMQISVIALSVSNLLDWFTMRDLRKRIEQLESDVQFYGMSVNVAEMRIKQLSDKVNK